MRRRRYLRRLLRVAPFVLAALVLAPTAIAAVRIVSVDSSGFPNLRVTVLAPKGSAAPVLTESGRKVYGVSAANLGQSKAMVLAIDRSQSMRGKPLANALAAARRFVGAAGANDHVGVVVFGRAAIAVQATSGGPSDAETALAGVSVDSRSGTALYDAIAVAADQLRQDPRPGRAIVVVTDGTDVSSLRDLGQAVAAAQKARASVYTIGIGGPQFDPSALRELASRTGGTYRQAASSAALAGIYASLQDELARTWQVSYPTAARPGDKLRLNATVPGAGSATTTVALPGSGGSSLGAPASGLVPSIGYSPAGTLVVSLISALLVLAACGFWFASGRGSRLLARLEPHMGEARKAGNARRGANGAAARKRLSDSIESALADVKQFKALQRLIERADVPWRAGELAAVAAGCAFVLGLLFAVASASPLIGLVGMCIGFAVPIFVVNFKANGRLKRLENQLPDVLITIAASLKAGHSFRQGIQSVVDEGAEPAAKEFKRVLTETQLGKPMDNALGDMAGRVGSENLTFVVTAVTIQRQIGGSLAGLFDMVADTVRQRQQFARKVKSLTAMGRMSAYVLVGLPFFMAGIVTLMNAKYMAPLYHTGLGHAMIIGGLVMMTLGSLMLKKIVSFKG
jgi:tight adherence protein B